MAMPLRVLVVRTDSLGDTILTTPLLSALRSHPSPIEIWVLASASAVSVLRGLSEVDRVLTTDPARASFGDRLALARVLWRERFDVTICVSEKWWPLVWTRASRAGVRIGFDAGVTQPIKHFILPAFLTHRVRLPADPWLASPLHEVERYLALLAPLGIAPTPTPLSLPLAESVITAARERVVDALGPARVPVAVHLSRKWRTEGWRDHSVADLCLAVLARRADVGLVIGGGADEASSAALIADCLHAGAAGRVLHAGCGELTEWAALLKACRAVVTMDTSAAHLAAALGVPVVDVFEAHRFDHVVSRWAPWQVAARTIRRDPIPAGTTEAERGAIEAAMQQAVVAALGELL
jgi:heptosyltransferase-3